MLKQSPENKNLNSSKDNSDTEGNSALFRYHDQQKGLNACSCDLHLYTTIPRKKQ